jgi:hypothetical protein
MEERPNFGMSCICLGQNSANIGSVWAQYSNKSSPIIVSPVKCEGALNFETQLKGFFTLPSPHSSTMERLIEAVFKKLEEQDNAACVSVLMDAAAGLGSSLGAALLNELSELLPGLSFNVGMVYNAEKDCLHGLGAYNSLLATQSALQVADFVMYRGLSETINLGSDTLEDAGALLSTDLMLALQPSLVWNDHLGSHSRSLLGSLPPSLYSSKLIDVRSSLWKACLNMRPHRGCGAATQEKYSPIRAMAVNLHNEYVQHNPENNQKEEVVPHACLLLGSLPSSAYSFRLNGNKGQAGSLATATAMSSSSTNPTSVSKKDVLANLKWAAPSVEWADLQSPCSGSTGGADARYYFPHGEKEDVNIAMMCYTSPYAHRLIASSVESVEKLLSRRAFMHHLEQAGISDEDMRSCIESVKADVKYKL